MNGDKVDVMLLEKFRGMEPTFHCAWQDCGEFFIGTTLPPGWKCLVITRDWILDLADIVVADREAVLCPVHATEFFDILKVLP